MLKKRLRFTNGSMKRFGTGEGLAAQGLDMEQGVSGSRFTVGAGKIRVMQFSKYF